MLQVHPTIDTVNVPGDDGSVQNGPTFVEEWKLCSNIPPTNIYSNTNHINNLNGWQIKLGKAKSDCFNHLSCTGFSHNPEGMTIFFDDLDLATCGPDGSTHTGAEKDPPAKKGIYTTYGHTANDPARRKLADVDLLAGSVSWELGGASISATFDHDPTSENFGSLTNLDVCAGRRRLEEHIDDAPISEEEKMAFWTNYTTAERDIATSDSMAKARAAFDRRRKLLFSTGFSGCVSYTSDPFEVNGCITYSVSTPFLFL
jgi:hypothetical protein